MLSHFLAKPNQISNKAFTIIELLISISIIGVLTSVAVPSFNSIIEKNEVKTLAFTLNTSLKHARNHAIQYQEIVIVCQINETNLTQCNPQRQRYANWQNGWLVYVDLNNNNELDKTDEILITHQPNNQTAVIFNQQGRLRFFPNGTARSAGFYFCKKQSKFTQYIRLLHTGRSRVSQALSEKQRLQCQNQLKI